MSGHNPSSAAASVAIQIQNLDFDLAPWRIEGERSERIWPIPGTWTVAPEPMFKRGVKGLLSCPRCQQAALITANMARDHIVNGVCELAAFQCRHCKFACNARLQHWDTKKLFCICYEVLDKEGFVTPDSDGQTVRKEYTHADSRKDAAFCFIEVRKHHVERFRVIDVGPVVGFFGQESDKDQTELTV